MIIALLLILVSVACFALLADVLLSAITVLFFRGAFFTKTSNKRLSALMKLLKLSPQDTLVDLGSGKGDVVIATAKAGARAVGLEVNPWLVFYSSLRLSRLGLTRQVSILHANFWSHDLSQYDVVVVYGIGYMMKHLKLKLERELKPGTKVASVYFPIPGWKTVDMKDEVRLYIVPKT